MAGRAMDDAPGPGAGAGAEVCETHIAIIFFVGDRAYKLKKPVALGFLDFSTCQARRRACERELALNRRFAPDVYLGLAEFRSHDGAPPEPLVVMRRMPADRRLAQLVREGRDVEDALSGVARLLAARHGCGERRPEVDAQGGSGALLARWEDSLDQVRSLTEPGGVECEGGDVREELAKAEVLVRRYLGGRQRLFDSRVDQGRAVDGHGDLLADDIFCLDDGPRVLDCLEFDDRLRYVDGLDDAAFLAMDLERLGAPEAAAFFLTRYSELSGDPAPPSLWHHYVAYRAFVRAKVAFIKAEQGEPDAAEQARLLVALTLRHLRVSAVRLVLVGGLPATGKSTLAGALCDRLGMTLLSSDRMRKELGGLPPEQPAPADFGSGIYTPEWTRRTYAALLDRARTLLSNGESVVLDATWSSAEHREAAAEVAAGTAADLVALRCEVPARVADQRLGARGPGTSDADHEVARRIAERWEPWAEAVRVDTSVPLPAAVDAAEAVVRPPDTMPVPAFRRPRLDPV